jgi:hypothetical protein
MDDAWTAYEQNPSPMYSRHVVYLPLAVLLALIELRDI